MTFLSILTRHLSYRAEMLRINEASLAMQSCGDWQHLIATDSQRSGWRHAAEMLVTLAHNATGDYVLILDDDDILLNADGIRQMYEAVQTKPAAVIFRGWHQDLGILPGPAHWMKRPSHGHIGSFDFIIQRELFIELAEASAADGYNSDFAIIDGVFERQLPVVWLDTLMCAVMRRSRGQ